MQLHQFNDPDALNLTFSKTLVRLLKLAIIERGHAYLAVSGGKTPTSLFNLLAQTELDWQSVTITLCDERMLSPDESDSNERMIRMNLLKDKAMDANFISLYSMRETDSARVDEIETRLANLPTFDVVILGMGEDGHTASLFPCSAEIKTGLADTNKSVILVAPTTAPYRRISLTKNRLLNTRSMFLHLVGENKLTVLNQAIAGQDSLEMPIRAFLNAPASNIHIMFAP